MRLTLSSIAAAAAYIPLSVLAKSSTGDRVLVVADSSINRDDYSRFFASLEEIYHLNTLAIPCSAHTAGRGYIVTHKSVKDSGVDLFKYEERQYDHLILFAPEGQKALPPSLSPQSILSAQFRGLNTLYLLPPSTSETIRDFVREYDLDLSIQSLSLVSPFASVSSPSSPSSSSSSDFDLHTTALIHPTHFTPSPGPILSPSTLTGGPIVYPSGSAHALGESPYLIPVLHAPKGAFVKGAEGVAMSGKNANLVSAFQTRDNARAAFVGSIEVLADRWWDVQVEDGEGVSHKTGNRALSDDLTKWVFQETGVVRAVSTAHSRVGGSLPLEEYTKQDNLTFALSLSTWHSTPSGGSWAPFHLDTTQDPTAAIQLEFTMLDPYVRTALKENKSREGKEEAVYDVIFQAPDRHGVFKFVINWFRPGYSFITTSDTASVVPLRHDEYPRFIVGAYPFYTATISTSAAFLLFCALWLSLGSESGEGEVKGKGRGRGKGVGKGVKFE